MTLYILQWCSAGVPADPQVFLDRAAAGAAMAKQATESRYQLVYDHQREPLGPEAWARVQAGELAYVGTENGDEELRLWEIEIPTGADDRPAPLYHAGSVKEATTVKTETMRQVHGYLTRRAQNWDAAAVVYEETDGRFVVERPGHDPLLVGQSHGEARQSIDALVRAHRVQNG